MGSELATFQTRDDALHLGALAVFPLGYSWRTVAGLGESKDRAANGAVIEGRSGEA